jgi:perosamine synthetase
MKKKDFTRRKFIATVSAGSVAAVVSNAIPTFGKITTVNNNTGKLAILGGTPVAPEKVWPKWPYVDEKVVEEIVKTTRSGIWCRIQSTNGTVPTFEKEFANLMGSKLSVCTGSGTQALSTCVEALGIGPGDEVITSPYTDPGTISSILTSRALPVMTWIWNLINSIPTTWREELRKTPEPLCRYKWEVSLATWNGSWRLQKSTI